MIVFALVPAFAWSQDDPTSFSVLNTPLDEQCPVLSPDGKLLAFTVADHPQNIGGNHDLGDIWFSEKTETGWGTPYHGGKLINNGLHNTVAGFSPDGQQLYLMGHYEQNGKPVTSQGLAVSVRTEKGWTAPVNIKIPYFKNKTPYNSGALSADGSVLVYSAEGYTTFGLEDVYITWKSEGTWHEPVPLNGSINTTGQDVSPSLSLDGKRLFFASNGHGGAGSFDIFYCERLDDSWTKWSAPKSLGPEVNSTGRELFYRETPSGRFLTSTLNSDGMANIRFLPSEATMELPVMINPTEEIKVAAVDTVKRIEEVKYDPNAADAPTRIWGRVINAKTNEMIANASIQFHATKTYTAVSGPDGSFALSIIGVDAYSVKVEAVGFIGEFERLDLKTQVLKELEMNFKLLPVEIGTTINLKNVLFERSKPVLLNSSYDELDMVADFMKTNPKVEILLSGHTDNQGRHDANMKLSRERVNVVKDYLISKGISANRITGKGFGGTKPIADNAADDTRALNRRVEFTIVKD